MTTRYYAEPFRPRQAPAVQQERVQGWLPDLRSIQNLGDALVQYGDAQSYKEGVKRGIEKQGDRTTYAGDEESFWDPAGAAGANKAARAQLAANKERELRQTMMSLEQTHYLDPDGFEKAQADYQQKFFDGVPVEQLPGLQNLYDRAMFRVKGQIESRKFINDRQNQAIDIRTTMDEIVQGVVQDTLRNGSNANHEIALTRWQGYARQLQNLDLMTPKQIETKRKAFNFAITQATAISRVRRGEDEQSIIRDIQDPKNPTYSVLRVEQQQKLMRDVRSEFRMTTSKRGSERALLREQFDALIRDQFLAGKVPDSPEKAIQVRDYYLDKMTELGVDEDDRIKNMRKFDEALSLGNDVRTLNLGSIPENIRQIKQAQDEANSFRGDPLEGKRLNDRANLLQKALKQKGDMIQADANRAAQLYNPALAAGLKYDTDADYQDSKRKLAQWTGDPNVQPMPREYLIGLKGQMELAQNTDEKGSVLGAVVMQYPDRADEIFAAAGLTDRDRLAGELYARGNSRQAGQLLLAVENAKTNKGLARDDDVERAFADAFGEKRNAAFFDDMRQPFADLYRWFLKNNNEETRKRLAFDALMADRQLVEVEGNPLILPKGADAERFQEGYRKFVADLIGNGVLLGTGDDSLTPSELRETLNDSRLWHWERAGRGWAVQFNDGRGIYVRTKTGRALAIFDPITGTHNVVPSDPNTMSDPDALLERNWGRPVRLDQKLLERVEEYPSIEGDSTTRITKRELEQPERTAKRAFQLGMENGLQPDAFLMTLTKSNPVKLQELAGAAFAITGGELRDWALDTFANSGLVEYRILARPRIRDMVKLAWSDPDQRLAPINGRIPEPSERLAILTERARQAALFEKIRPGSYVPSKKKSRGLTKIGFDEQGTPALDRLQQAVLQRESGGDYEAINRYGYVGGYQFGAAALVDLGFIRADALNRKLSQKAILSDPRNWTIPGGLTAFLGNREMQDHAFRDLVEMNLDRLIEQGVIRKDRTLDDAMGWLSVAHLLGAGGAKKAKETGIGADAFGTQWSEYHKLGKDAALRANLVTEL